MNNKTGTTRWHLGFLASVLWMSAGQLAAQDTGGVRSSFEIGQRFENREQDGFDDDEDAGFRSLTNLSFGTRSETRQQRIGLDLSADIIKNFTTESDATFDNQRADLDYGTENRSTLLEVGMAYRRDEIDNLVFDTSTGDDTLISGEGLREVATFRTDLTLGRDSRISSTLNYRAQANTFSGTPDGTFNDSTRQSVSGRINFKVNPTLTVNTFAERRQTDEEGEGATDRETTRVGIGLDYAISPTVSFAGNVAYSEEESREITVLQTDGLNYQLALTIARPRGPINIAFTETDTFDGQRRSLTGGRQLELSRGDLSFSIGGVKVNDFDVQALANLVLNYDISRTSNASVTLEQAGTRNDDDVEVITSRLSVDYDRDLSSLSSVGVTLALVDENTIDPAGVDEQSLRVGLEYSYMLTRNWDLEAGYEFSSIREDDEVDREESTVFVGVTRSFGARR